MKLACGMERGFSPSWAMRGVSVTEVKPWSVEHSKSRWKVNVNVDEGIRQELKLIGSDRRASGVLGSLSVEKEGILEIFRKGEERDD